MAPRPTYTLTFAPEVLAHLRRIEKRFHSLIRQEMVLQLKNDPDQATRNRKRLSQPAPLGATWELRCGPDNRFRIFYEIDDQEMMVSILAIGVKEGNRLWIGGEEYIP